jgi:hypothetical protein
MFPWIYLVILRPWKVVAWVVRVTTLKVYQSLPIALYLCSPFWRMSGNPKRLSLEKIVPVIAANIVMEGMARLLESNQGTTMVDEV